ncbi:MAG: alpha/beta hydrolase [Chloroflexi bacterium]|nr:alpha/beta hydrolase [Chloroflexota bacterium]
MPSERRTVQVPGGRLHVAIDGDGPSVVLVHAGIVDSRSWDPLVPFLVAAGYRAIRYDVRGYGRSTTDEVAFSNRHDLRAVLDDAGVVRAAMVGNSRGAMICLDTIIETPERAVAFAWVGGGIGGYDVEPEPFEAAIYERADALMEAKDLDGLADLEVELWVDGAQQLPGRAPAWIRDAVREMDRPLLQPDRVMGRPIPLEPPANGRLGEIRIPVLAVVGGLDTSATRAAAVRLEAAVPGARRVVLPDVAHMVGMEAPDRLAALIVDLLQPLGSWA